MEDWNVGHYLILFFMASLTLAAILLTSIRIHSDKNRAVYDKHLHSKPRDGDNT